MYDILNILKHHSCDPSPSWNCPNPHSAFLKAEASSWKPGARCTSSARERGDKSVSICGAQMKEVQCPAPSVAWGASVRLQGSRLRLNQDSWHQWRKAFRDRPVYKAELEVLDFTQDIFIQALARGLGETGAQKNVRHSQVPASPQGESCLLPMV